MKRFSFAFIFVIAGLAGCRNKNAVSTDPQENRYYRLYSEIYNQWGKVSADSTRQKLNAYLQEFPENADAQMMAGNLARACGEHEKAIACYRKAIALQPLKAVYYSALGNMYNVQHQLDSAEKYLLRAFELKDTSAYTFLSASLLYLRKNEKEKSMAYTDSAFLNGNTSPVICSGLSFVYYRWNEMEKSRSLFNQAVALGLKDTPTFNEVLEGKLKLEEYYRKNY